MERKKGSSWPILIVAIMFLAFGILSTVLYSDLMFGTKVSNINKLLYEGSIKSNEDSYVEMDIDAVLDNFAETSHKSYGITTGKDQHYLVWLDDDSMIAVSVKSKKDISAMDEIMELTWDYVDGKTDEFTKTPLHLKGKIKQMSTEMRKYFKQSLDYFGITDADRDIHYYVIDCTDSQLSVMLLTGFFFVFFILMMVAFFAGRAKDRRAMLAYDADSSYSYSREYGTYGEGIDDPVSTDDMK